MPEIAAIGEILIDFIAEQEGPLADVKSFRKFPGGAPTNVVVGVTRLGIPCTLISKVGDDPFGLFLKKELEREGVDTTHIAVDKEIHTGVVFVQLIKAQPEFILYSNVAYNNLKMEDISKPMIQQLKILHFGSVMFAREPSRTTVFNTIKYAKNFDALVTYDVNVRKDLWKDRYEDMWSDILAGLCLADVVKFSETELQDLGMELGIRKESLPELLDVLFRLGPRLIIITKGAAGATLFQKIKRKIIKVPIPPYSVEPVDTTGAGDAFMAAIIAGIFSYMENKKYPSLNKRKLFKIGRFAVIIAALSTLKYGAWSVPYLKDIKIKEIETITERLLKLSK